MYQNHEIKIGLHAERNRPISRTRLRQIIHEPGTERYRGRATGAIIHLADGAAITTQETKDENGWEYVKVMTCYPYDHEYKYQHKSRYEPVKIRGK